MKLDKLVKTNISHAVLFIVTIQGALSNYVPDLRKFSPNLGGDFKPKTDEWQHYEPKQQLSASVADFVSSRGDCVRLVVFTGYGAPLDHIKVPCDSQDPFLGLMFASNRLWYFGMAFVTPLQKYFIFSKNGIDNKLLVLKPNGKNSCEKTFWRVKYEESGKPIKPYGRSPENVSGDDKECTVLLTKSTLPPIMILSPKGGTNGYTKTSDEQSYNPSQNVGARLTTYQNGVACFRLLQFLSKDRTIDSMQVSCGPPITNVKQDDKSIYIGTLAAVKSLDEPDTFIVITNPRLGTSRKPLVCVKRTFVLVHDGNGYISKKLSTTIDFAILPDCAELMQTPTAVGGQFGDLGPEKLFRVINLSFFKRKTTTVNVSQECFRHGDKVKEQLWYCQTLPLILPRKKSWHSYF